MSDSSILKERNLSNSTANVRQVSHELKAELVENAQQITKLGLAPLTQGNMSLRDPDTGLILMTPHDFPYERMTTDDILVLALDGGAVVEGQHEISFETPVHLAVYDKRPDVMAIVHTEPVYATAFGVANKPIQPVHIAMALAVGGEVPVMAYEKSGSREFGLHMLEAMGERNAVIWANHGLLTIGDTLQTAIRCTVLVEMAARVYYTALNIGEPTPISDDVIQNFWDL
jgi:L-ribulose-5-phosphate 4-epimerase